MPEKLGRYRLMKLLATGGMGEVFLARQEGPGGFAKMVVVKRILRHLARDQGFIDLFLNEARLAAQLQHPNIAQVFTLEHEDDSWFITMEYVHGCTLRAVLERARARNTTVPATIACRLASQVLQGLHFAHELTDERGQPLGILHRDVSPENVLLSFSGVVKLIDFGIARAMTGSVTRVGNPKGKVAYMAPELTVSGAEVDRRSDVYGVGVLLYEMLRLNRPPNVPSTVEEATAPRREFVEEVMIPRVLNEVLAKAMAPDVSKRFASAHAMSEALEVYLMAVGQMVLPTHVARFFKELFGEAAFEINESVVRLGTAATLSGLSRMPEGTAPLLLGTAPLVRSSSPSLTAISARSLPAVPTSSDDFSPTKVLSPPPPEPATPLPKPRLTAPLLIGSATLAVMTFMVVLAVWPQQPPRVVSPPVAPPTPVAAQLVAPPPMPEQPHLDAGEMTIVLEADPRPRTPSEVSAVDSGVEAVAKKQAAVGHVLLRVSPAATEVFYAGRRLGVTPLTSVEVAPGVAAFVLKNQKLGVTRRLSVKVPAGATVVLRADLTRP